MHAACSKLLFILCLLLVLQACKTNKTEAPVLDTEVEKEYELDLWETLANATRTFQVRANTVKIQDCQNYYIESSFSRKGNTIEINLGKPQIPGICDQGAGPAKANFDLETLSNGTYNVTIKLGQIVPSSGRLTVSSSSYFFSINNPIGFRFVHNQLLRIPDFSVWGYVAYDAKAQATANQFYNDLAAISFPQELTAGYYGYFSILETGQMELGGTKVSTDRPIQPILRRFQANEKDLEKLIQTYREKYGQSIQIHLRNVAGKEY